MAPPDRAGAPTAYGGVPLTAAGKAFRRTIHETIVRVTEDLERDFHFNTAIAAIMELMNALQAFGATPDGRGPAADRSALRREAVETVLLLLGPFCPHITEELWSRLGHSRGLSEERWPEADRTALQRDEVTVVVQVDGRVRGRLTVEVGAPDERVTTLALADAKVRPWIESRQVARVVVIPGRLVNIVTGAN